MPADAGGPRRGLGHVVLGASFAFPGSSGSPLLQMDAVDALRRQGVEVTVVRYVGLAGARTVRRRWRDVEVWDVPAPAAPAALAALARRRPDVVYAHGTLAAELLAPLALAARLPLVLEVHAAGPEVQRAADRRGPDRVAHRTAAAAVRRALDTVVALSQRDADVLAAAGWRAPGGIEVIYPPVPDALLAADGPPPAGAPEPDGPPTVGYLGGFQPWQGTDLLLEAMAAVWATHPEVEVHLWGADDDQAVELRARSASAAGRVVVGGRVERDQVLPLLRRFTALAIARPDIPMNATTSRKLGEFLASGRPVVATDVADHRRLLEGGAGVVVAPTAAAVAEGLRGLLDDPSRADAVGRAGAVLAQARFAAATVEARRLDLLVEAADRRRGARRPRRGRAPREGATAP